MKVKNCKYLISKFMLLGFDKAFIEGDNALPLRGSTVIAFEKSHAASCDKFRSRSKYLQLVAVKLHWKGVYIGDFMSPHVSRKNRT